MGSRGLVIALLYAAVLRAQSTLPGTPPTNLNPRAAMPAPPFMACPVGAPLGAIDLQVEAGGQRLPFRSINRLSEGDSVLYSPILRGKEKRTGEIALVLVPERREPGQETLFVTEPKPADRAGQWQMPQTIALAAVVYGPSGLSRRKVVNSSRRTICSLPNWRTTPIRLRKRSNWWPRCPMRRVLRWP